ncbi:uncharacterized protein [Drosophila pseudoobscura]|uniref:Copper transporter n=1 Tax=Drosophila pseudoobscura pseudoobscura TaxID=46245 RepID=A0A6I8UYK0_DROPS|nr:uncharacterized protein LOC6902424 [Drosophila pseudoobscura]
MVMLNPIEIVCFYVVQPILDYLTYLMLEVHYVAYLAGLAVIGIVLGLAFSIISVIWYKSTLKDLPGQPTVAVEHVHSPEGPPKKKDQKQD